MDDAYVTASDEKGILWDDFSPADDQLYSPWQLGEHDMQALFMDLHSEDYMEALDVAMANLEADPGNTFITDWQVQQTMVENDEAFEKWSREAFNSTRAEENWGEEQLAEPNYVIIADDWYSDRDWTNKWNRQQSEAVLKTAEKQGDQDTQLAMVTEPEIIMAVDQGGKSTPMACAMMVVKDLQGKPCSRLLKVLFDSGGSKSMCHRRILPMGARIDQPRTRSLMRTLAGTYAPLGTVQMKGMRLPAFDKHRVIEEHQFHVFESDCRYDVILGGDFLEKIGMNLLYKTLEIEWLGNVLPMETIDKPDRVAAHVEQYLAQLELESTGIEIDQYLSAPILDAKYEKLDAHTLVTTHCPHLSPSQQDDLRMLLSKHSKLFDGTLGRYPGEPMHIELEEGAQPVYRRPYPVPVVHMETFRKELDHLVQIGVLSPTRDSEWGLPTFIVPKKDGRVRWVSDMRELNKVIKRTQYTLPIINDVLRKRRGYEFLTKLDISMQYYTFELDEESRKLCTIVTPFGAYCYNRVPMGLKISPGFAQARMEEVLRGLDSVECYIDDIGVFNTSWDQHLAVLGEVLQRLEQNGFTINPLKCEWGVKETDWLGYWLTPTGLKPWTKKIDAILKMKPPSTATEMRTFLGMVTYYRDMWPRRSHILAPFTKMSGLPKKAKLEWTEEMGIAFKQMKAVIANEAMMAYPDHNLPFDIYTDASDYQMGACIMQNGQPVAYYSRKLSGAQKNYTTMEKELLAIVMVLLEYRTMLLGAQINVFTDHRNLTFNNFNTQRVLRWRCLIEEYSPKMFYLEGKRNVLADAFSRLPRFDDPTATEGKSTGPLAPPEPLHAYHSLQEVELYECLQHLPEWNEYVETYNSYLNLPHSDENPLSLDWLRDTQQSDKNLIARAKEPGTRYHWRAFGDVRLLCYTKVPGKEDTQWKICLGTEALDSSIHWFHQLLNHPGKQRLLQGMDRYYHPDLRKHIDKYSCDACQRYKLDGRGVGKLAPRVVRAAPWEQVDVDLIGPWSVDVRTGSAYEFMALTCIDRVTGLAELIRIDDKTAHHVASKFDECWLSRYPRPMMCCHDNGGEFTGWEFQQLLADFGIKDVPTTSRNPASNGICERMHQTVGNVVRTLIHENKPRTLKHAQTVIDQALASASHAVRTNVNQATGYTPGALAFHRDMLLNIPLVVDLLDVRAKRQLRVDRDLMRANARRSAFDYKQGDHVLKQRHDRTKLGERWDGPYPIKRVHVNGNVTIALKPGVFERINIRRVKPYLRPTRTPNGGVVSG